MGGGIHLILAHFAVLIYGTIINIEFNSTTVEQIFADSVADSVNEKRYVLWNERWLKVTALAEEYEPGDVLLTVESAKSYTPPLSVIAERAKYQAYRLKQWQDSASL